MGKTGDEEFTLRKVGLYINNEMEIPELNNIIFKSKNSLGMFDSRF